MGLIGIFATQILRKGVDLMADRYLANQLKQGKTITQSSALLETSPLINSSEAVARQAGLYNVTASWNIANDAMRRLHQPGLSRAAVEQMAREASFRYNEVRRIEGPGTVPHTQSTLMYMLLTTALREPLEATRAAQESLSLTIGGRRIPITQIQAFTAGSGLAGLGHGSLKLELEVDVNLGGSGTPLGELPLQLEQNSSFRALNESRLGIASGRVQLTGGISSSPIIPPPPSSESWRDFPPPPPPPRF